jgi:tRNA dimethylallyltransferase
MAQPVVVCLTGPTAAGKSAITLALARRWPLEIINVDSATLYRGMDIGTAKPSLEEQTQVAHHLLDIRDPAQSYSAAEFSLDALRLIDEIRARGRIPLLAGGTMLYYHALCQGLHPLPSANPALRAELDARAAQFGWPALHAELAARDPVTAARLATHDSQRIQRALEICILSGEPMSSLLRRLPRRQQASDNLYVTVSLEPSDRLGLHARIAQRFDAMLQKGFVDEVGRLYARADLHPGLPSIRCVGYRQLWAYWEGRVELPTACQQAVAATRQLAKRQLTWLKAQPKRIVVDCLAKEAAAQVIDTMARLQSSPG